MDSVVLYTEEIDDLQEAAKELFDQAKAFPLKKNSVALLYAEEETDLKALYALLSKQWDFPVLGCTAMAMLMSNKGYRSIGIAVMLMTGDDVSFSAGISDALRRENCESEIARTYAAVKAAETGKTIRERIRTDPAGADGIAVSAIQWLLLYTGRSHFYMKRLYPV